MIVAPYQNNFRWFEGVVENRNDPLKLFRVQVRIFGIHTNNKSKIPTSDLFWAQVMHPVTSAAMNGIGNTPSFVEGTHVIGFFRDGDNCQDPIVMGTVAGIPSELPKDTGFFDPNKKYPKANRLNEPDTSRLARGVLEDTIFTKKDSQIKTNIAGVSGTWNQPESPYNTQFPFNKVMETESGHVLEFDDSPDNERIHLAHRTGTFYEVDRNGTRITKIVGDSYEIIDRNGYISISGNSNLTVSGNINLNVESDANVQIYGNVNLNVHGNLNQTVNGDFRLKANNIIMESDNKFDTTAESISMDSELIALNSGFASKSGLSTPSKLTPKYPNIPNLANPTRKSDAIFVFESPEDNIGAPDIPDAMPEFQNAIPVEIKQKNIVVQDAVQPTSEDVVQIVPPTCEAFKDMTRFDSNMVLHKDSTGYSWTLGKLLNGNELTEIVVRGIKYTKADIVCNLKQLAENILGRINEKVGRVDERWFLTSCYRNDIPSGGSATSQHLSGQACDIVIGNNYNYDESFEFAKDFAASLPYDQFILEYLDSGRRKNWMHISYIGESGRRQILTFLNHKTAASGSLKKLA